MGVLKAPRSKIRIEDLPDLDYADFLFSDESDFESDSDDAANAGAILSVMDEDTKRRRKARQERALRRYRKNAEYFGGEVQLKPASGIKKRRRAEHAQEIYALVDPEEICYDYSDMCPKVETAFSKLFLDKESMALWQSLAEKEADQQERFLKFLNDCEPSTAASGDSMNVVGGCPLKVPKNYHRMKDSEKRFHHPLHSANARFERLDKKLKTALSKNRGVPYEMIDSIEHRLRDFFTGAPNGVYVDIVDNAFARMFYHAVAAFLNLVSASVSEDDGGKILEIRNKKRDIFIEPYEYLVAFLHRRKGKSLSFSL